MTESHPLTTTLRDAIRRSSDAGTVALDRQFAIRLLSHLERSERKAPLPLTPRQHEVLAWLRESIGAKGYAPSFDEIAAHFGFASLSTVSEHLEVLEAKGYIRRTPMMPRGIALVEFEKAG